MFEKSCIRETKHLSADADSSTDTTVGWTKNTQKPNFVENEKNHQKHKNSETSRNMKNERYALRPEVSNPSGSMVSTMFCWTKNTPKLDFFEKRKKSSKTQKLKNV